MTTYYYHGTTMENLPSIAQYGLRPRQRGGPSSWSEKRFHRLGLFVTLNEDDAIWWGIDRQANLLERILRPNEDFARTTEAVVLRFSSNFVRATFNDTLPLGSRGKSLIIMHDIPPEAIEIRAGAPDEHGPWEPLRRYMKSG